MLAKNPAAFATRYPTNNITAHRLDRGNLARRGEMLSLADPAGTNILTFTYSQPLVSRDLQCRLLTRGHRSRGGGAALEHRVELAAGHAWPWARRDCLSAR